ncbi:MAG: putative quinol monooxygenase [Burkholderiaceae bacterium]
MKFIVSAFLCVLTALLPMAHAQSPSPAAADGPIVLIVQFEISPGREEQFKQRALTYAQMAQQAVPGVVYRLHSRPEQPGQFVFYEYFPSKAALDKVQNEVTAAHRAQFGPTPAGMFAKPPAEVRWAPLN